MDIINDAEIVIRNDFVRNILLAGAVPQVKGLDLRLVSEIKPVWSNVVVKNDKPAISVWIGGSIVGSLSCVEGYLITAKEYGDFGLSILSTKCLQ